MGVHLINKKITNGERDTKIGNRKTRFLISVISFIMTNKKNNNNDNIPAMPPKDSPPPYTLVSSGSQDSSAPIISEHTPLYPDVPKYYSPTPTPNPHYSPMISPQPEFVILPAPTLVRDLRDRPAVTVCPHCHNTVLSSVKYTSGAATWLTSIALCFIGITSWGCCLFPFCINDLKDCVHKCPSCNKLMAKYTRLNGTVEINR
ncbi:hypothetical protein G9A89_013354 [Geosiphon pyriformis]|nr:hypothetical protein G9A89_013354 [Geosiphon pyriformis]